MSAVMSMNGAKFLIQIRIPVPSTFPIPNVVFIAPFPTEWLASIGEPPGARKSGELLRRSCSRSQPPECSHDCFVLTTFCHRGLKLLRGLLHDMVLHRLRRLLVLGPGVGDLLEQRL